MGNVAVLKIANGGFDQGFDVSLQVCSDNALPSREILGKLPANTEFESLYTVKLGYLFFCRSQRDKK